MRVTALGTNAAYPGPDNACSGWLVEHEDTYFLIDCGTGVVAKLQRFLPLARLTAIVISHMHADHFFDLFPLRYAYRYGGAKPKPPVHLYLPPGGYDTLRRVTLPLGTENAEDFFPSVLRVQEYDPGGALQEGPLKVTFAPGQHYVPSWAISVEGGSRVVFTADTGPSAEVEALARGADLLVSEATYLSMQEETSGRRGHMTGREAGELAARSRPGRVLLTHHWPHRDPHQALEQARAAFSGDIAVAEPARTYEV